MKLSEAKARREAIITRELEIRVALCECKRKYIVDKIDTDFGTRVTLESEAATLSLEKRALNMRIQAAKDGLRSYRNTLVHAHLIRLLVDRGMPELVREAERMADDSAGAEV